MYKWIYWSSCPYPFSLQGSPSLPFTSVFVSIDGATVSRTLSIAYCLRVFDGFTLKHVHIHVQHDLRQEPGASHCETVPGYYYHCFDIFLHCALLNGPLMLRWRLMIICRMDPNQLLSVVTAELEVLDKKKKPHLHSTCLKKPKFQTLKVFVWRYCKILDIAPLGLYS